MQGHTQEVGAAAGREGLWDDTGGWLKHHRNRTSKDLLVEHCQGYLEPNCRTGVSFPMELAVWPGMSHEPEPRL